MRRRLRLAAVVIAAGAVSLSPMAMPVAAQEEPAELIIEVSVPDEAPLGDPVEILVTVRSAADGAPVAGYPLAFFADTDFAGVVGRIELGTAETNDLGVARISHEFSQLRTYVIEVEAVGQPDVSIEPVPVAILVGRQLHLPEEAVEIPGLGAWLVTVIVAGVWAVMVVAAVWVIALARAGRPEPTEEEEAVSLRARLASYRNLATGVTLVMIAVASGLTVLLVRSPETHHNRNPQGYNRTAVAFVEASYQYPGPGIAEESPPGGEEGVVLFFGRGCAGCHGIRAEGTAAAGSPVGVSREWLTSVIRTGIPGLMPAYSVDELSNADIVQMHRFLEAIRETLPTTTTTTTTTLAVTATSTTSLAPGATLTLSYETDVAPLFRTHCVRCHGSLGGWSASNYTDVMTTGDNAPVVIAGDVESSLLAQKMTGTQTLGDRMPPARLLLDAEIQIVLDWIAGGAQP